MYCGKFSRIYFVLLLVLICVQATASRICMRYNCTFMKRRIITYEGVILYVFYFELFFTFWFCFCFVFFLLSFSSFSWANGHFNVFIIKSIISTANCYVFCYPVAKRVIISYFGGVCAYVYDIRIYESITLQAI